MRQVSVINKMIKIQHLQGSTHCYGCYGYASYALLTDANNRFYTEHNGKGDKRSAPPYKIEVFKDIGRAFLIGVLDFCNCNPVSRIPTSWYKNLEGVQKDLI